MLYTRTGDNGYSDLFGTNVRLPKDSPIYEALGTVDECNSLLGMCRAEVFKSQDEIDVGKILLEVQECLFIIQSEIVGAKKTISEDKIENMEKVIERIEVKIVAPSGFVIPGATKFSALYDYARCVVRRAERKVIAITPTVDISVPTLVYLNRLSSLLYVLARYSAKQNQVKELTPTY